MRTAQVYVALAFVVTAAYGLSCGICRDATCPDTSTCTAGTMLDDCNCCAICSKAEGDKCAGRYGRFGNCGDGLTCDQGQAPPGTDPFYHWLRSEGQCVPVKKKSTTAAPEPEASSSKDQTEDDLAEQSLNNQT